MEEQELLAEGLPAEGMPPQLFEVDTTLSPLEAVMQWAAEGHPISQRVAYILSIPAAAAESSLEEARCVLLPLLSQLVFDDSPDVKHATAEVLGPLGPILASKDGEAGEAGGSADAMDLLVLAHRLLQDAEHAVQEAAASSVAMFAGLLSEENRREHLTAVVEELMRNYDDEQMQECAVDLLTKVAAAAGPAHPEWCEECALPRMLKLGMHRDYNIRVHAVAGLVRLSACLPEEPRGGELLSAFADLAADSVWSVRQECASEMAALAVQLPRHAVRDRLLPLWQALATDVSAWVKAAALRQAGPLLASLHPDDCSEELLTAFVSATTGPATLTEACAHYLPAVLQNLGAQHWPRLKDAVATLAASDYVSVRVALAERIHEVAQLLGPAVVGEDLLPVIEKLSADEHESVAGAQALNIRALLEALPPEARLGQLAFLARVHPEDGRSCGQWRMRLVIAEQLAGIAALLEQQGLAEVLLPATLRLCEDPVAAVREAAAAQLGSMVRSLLAQAGGGGVASGEPAQAQQAQEEEAEEEAQMAATANGPAAAEQEAEPAAAAAQEQQEQPPSAQEAEAAAAEEEEEEEEQAHEAGMAQRQGGAAAVVQQIVQHLVELQRSGCHRSRQTYLVFCSTLLLPQPQPEAEAEAEQQAKAEQPAEAGQPAEGEQAQGGGAAAALPPSWPQLPEAVAQSGIALGLLEGAVALAADPVPNVRMSVARLLAALQRQQPALLAASPKAAAALAALQADVDRDVQAAACA